MCWHYNKAELSNLHVLMVLIRLVFLIQPVFSSGERSQSISLCNSGIPLSIVKVCRASPNFSNLDQLYTLHNFSVFGFSHHFSVFGFSHHFKVFTLVSKKFVRGFGVFSTRVSTVKNVKTRKHERSGIVCNGPLTAIYHQLQGYPQLQGHNCLLKQL